MSDQSRLADVSRPEPESNEEVCGETYDHDIPAEEYEERPEGPWSCRRCGAEFWED
jgi:hypothetical protein